MDETKFLPGPSSSLTAVSLSVGIYKISRDRSVRETSHKVNIKESTWVNR